MKNNLNRSIDFLINNNQYKEKLQLTLTSIKSKASAATTESSIASIFEMELFHFIKMYLGIDIVFDKEIGQSDLKQKRHIFSGRMDAVSNDLIIEYKKGSKLLTENHQKKASKQVQEYLEQLYMERDTEYSAILTDGQKIRYFYYINKKLHYTPFKSLELDDLDKVVKSLVNVGNKKFVPENIINDFKLNSEKGVTLRLAKSLFHIIMNNMTDKTDMLFQEWQELFHLSENDNGQNFDIEKRKNALGNIFGRKIDDNEMDYKALFVLQTTYAIIVKLIACKVITRLSSESQKNIMYFSDLSCIDSNQLREFMDGLEEGYTFAIGGIRNLLEGDFFSWYAAENQWSEEESECIKDVIVTLEGYSDLSFAYGYTAIDIFKDLYMEIMPNEVRHSLGEYFTPSWIADYVIESSKEMITNKNWRAIDPCCGSGIFVVTLIKHVIGEREIGSLTKEEKKQLLEEIVSRVQGIDINPLSVLTARVSYLLAIAPLLDNEQIEIPVYLGDSANMPHTISLEGVNCYEYTISTKQGDIEITLPCTFVESKQFLQKMNVLQTIIKQEDETLVYKKLLDEIDSKSQNNLVLEKIKILSEKFVQLHKKNWDGIWLRIVTNYMLAARIKDIDIIAGNPPWVKWEYLPQVYAEKIKRLCLDRHLFSGQTYMGAISLNICALISNVTASSWLNKGGVLAFLMPKTLMTQDSYAGFRNFYIDVKKNKRLFLQKIDDWSKAGHPFMYTTEKFLTYYYQEQYVDYRTGLPINYIEKKKGIDVKKINVRTQYEEVKELFLYKTGKAYQLDKSRTGFTMVEGKDTYRTELYSKIVGKCDYKARSGVEFTPAEIYFVEPLKESSEEGKYFFKNSKFTNSFYKAKTNNGFLLETKYIRPVIKSPDIREFGVRENNNYCIFPYDNGKSDCTALDQLAREAEDTAKYFITNKKLINKQSERSKMIAKGKEFYALSKIGAYTYGENIVAFRDNTKLVAAVIQKKKVPWNETIMPVCAKHSPYISMDKKRRWITEMEAYYICGILNTNVVQEYYKFTFSERSYSIDFNIKMPLYDAENPLHKRMASLSKKAHGETKSENKIEKIKKEMERLYIEICETAE